MTVQLAIANCSAVALASDRHIFRDGPARSTGQEVKVARLRGRVPAAMMAAGPLAVLNTPVARFALLLESALAGVADPGPEPLAEAVLEVLTRPVPSGEPEAARAEADLRLLAETAEQIVQRALSKGGDPRAALAAMLAEDADAARAAGGEALLHAHGRATWAAWAQDLSLLVSKPRVAAALAAAPELVGEAVFAALARGGDDASKLYLTVGLCCPATGVPVLIALQLWRGIGGRLLSRSRLGAPFEAIWKANRTVVAAQGSGRPVIEAMIDGIGEDHWNRLSATSRTRIGPAMSARWDKAHDRIAVSSLRELGAIASGLVRGAETIGYLTREGEGTIAPVDCVIVTPQGLLDQGLPSGTRRELAEA